MVLRGFIALVGVAALAWPLAAQPQQAIPVIGFLHGGSPHAPAMPHLVGFRQGLKEAGFVEGRTVAIEFRWAEHRYERLPAVRDKPSLDRVAALPFRPCSSPAPTR